MIDFFGEIFNKCIVNPERTLIFEIANDGHDQRMAC